MRRLIRLLTTRGIRILVFISINVVHWSVGSFRPLRSRNCYQRASLDHDGFGLCHDVTNLLKLFSRLALTLSAHFPSAFNFSASCLSCRVIIRTSTYYCYRRTVLVIGSQSRYLSLGISLIMKYLNSLMLFSTGLPIKFTYSSLWIFFKGPNTKL